MRKLIYLLSLTATGLILFSCKQNKEEKKIASKEILESQYYTDSIYSEHLGEYRKHNVYLPKGFNKKQKYNIIYATDGISINKDNFYKKTFDSLINTKVIAPTIVILSHCNVKIADSTSRTTGDGKPLKLSYRSFEYIDDYVNDTEDAELKHRFKNHMTYFHDELITKVEQQLNQPLSKNDRYFYGYSNGAGFGMSLLNNHPDIIGTYLCFSTFGGDIQTNLWKKDVQYPNLYLIYGSKEPFFLKMDADFIKVKYDELNSSASIEEFEGGHDRNIWNEKFIATISNILSKQ